LSQPLPIQTYTLSDISSLFYSPANARPVQELNDRKVQLINGEDHCQKFNQMKYAHEME